MELEDYIQSLGYEIHSLKRLKTDSINLLYDLSSDKGSYIVKMMVRTPNDEVEQNRFKRLQLVSEQMGGMTPKVVHLDTEPKIIDEKTIYSVMIMEKIEGDVTYGWKGFEMDKRDALTRKLAAIMNKMRAITFDKVKIIDGGPDWNVFLNELSEEAVEILNESKQIGYETLNMALDFIQSNQQIWQYDGPLCLLHRDLWVANIIIDNDDNPILLDWEWSWAGDPHFDFTNIDRQLMQNDPELIELFYLELGITRDDDYLLKMRVYRVIQHLYGCAFGYLHHNPSQSGFKSVAKEIRDLINGKQSND